METANEEVRDVSFDEALADPEEGGGAIDAGSIDQAAPTPAPRPRPQTAATTTDAPEVEPVKEPPKPDDLEVFAPMVAAREWTLGKDEFTKTYIQRELSVLGKAQWFSLVGEIFDEALSGENKLSLNSLLTPPTPRAGGNLSPIDFQDADTFVHAVGKLLNYSPKFLHKSVCIWLEVPDYEWELVRDMMSKSPTEGGMSDDMFEEIFATFIDQNYGQIIRFFQERFPRLRGRWQARQKEIQESRSRLQRP